MANIDTSKFECFRSKVDGSMYYGQLCYVDKSTNAVLNEVEVSKLSASQLTEGYNRIRHGYGLQIYNGQRNSDGILTKYEGLWQMNKKHG